MRAGGALRDAYRDVDANVSRRSGVHADVHAMRTDRSTLRDVHSNRDSHAMRERGGIAVPNGDARHHRDALPADGALRDIHSAADDCDAVPADGALRDVYPGGDSNAMRRRHGIAVRIGDARWHYADAAGYGGAAEHRLRSSLTGLAASRAHLERPGPGRAGRREWPAGAAQALGARSLEEQRGKNAGSAAWLTAWQESGAGRLRSPAVLRLGSSVRQRSETAASRPEDLPTGTPWSGARLRELRRQEAACTPHREANQTA